MKHGEDSPLLRFLWEGKNEAGQAGLRLAHLNKLSGRGTGAIPVCLVLNLGSFRASTR